VRRAAFRVLAAALALVPVLGAARVLDDFRDADAWRVVASDDVRASARRDARGLCLDYDFRGVSGYAMLRRAVSLDFPADFTLFLKAHGEGPRNDFQLKLVDASGENVWWRVLPAHEFSGKSERLRVRKRQVVFAWGPASERALRSTAAIELVVAAGRDGGGRGSACFERLEMEERAPAAEPAPEPILRTMDARTLRADLRELREFNGVELRWHRGGRPTDYDLEGSSDGGRWQLLRRVRGARGELDTLFVPESEARLLRLQIASGDAGVGALRELRVVSPREWPDLNAAVGRRAREAPRGTYPRAWRGEQSYWTLLAVDGGGARSALLSEDGALEAGRGGFSVEPFVELPDGARASWADVRIEHRLRDGYLPIPSVRWTHPRFTLEVEAGAIGTRERPRAVSRYVVRNTSGERARLRLLLAVRPMQVNPPAQFLGIAGGVSPIRTLGWRGDALRVEGRAALWPSRRPDALALSTWDTGAVSRVPLVDARDAEVTDPQAFASAVLAWNLDLSPDEAAEISLAIPLAKGDALKPADAAVQTVAAGLDGTARSWHARLDRVGLEVPAKLRDSLRTALAHILMSRDGPALQPGTRAYARTWIRDGAMMVAALLRLGEVEAAREFVDWFAPRIFANGKVPCCVDARGSDPVVENDSHGELIFAVAEVWRYTGETRWLESHWRAVAAATRHMETLRQGERIEANRQGARRPWWGLMPKSISHEGYSERPVHSYWDDFWALRGFRDAAAIASALGHANEARDFARWRDEFEADLAASIRATAELHRIDFVAGSAELGDFDATSTTIALDPAGAERLLPPGMLEATFERYWRESRARAEGTRDWKDYTPYELRAVGALTRLGQPQRALAMLDFFFNDQRPQGWNQWAEVVGREPRTVRFLGDMPHAWVASDFIRSALDLLAYEDVDRALVIGAGIPDTWLEAAGVAVRGLPTPYGPLTFSIRREKSRILVELPEANARPPGGLIVKLPGREPVRVQRLPARFQVD
jgi:hypothetical protein